MILQTSDTVLSADILLLFLGKLFSYFGKISLRKDRLRKSFLIKFSIHSCNHEFISGAPARDMMN